MPKQIPPQNWSDDMVRERIERVTQSDAFEIRLNKDVEYNLRASVLNYIKNNQALAIDTALISLMPHAEFFKFCKTYTEKRIHIKTCRTAEIDDTAGKRYGQILHL